MKWNLSTVLFWVLFLAFLFIGLSPVYSEIILTDEEWTTLLTERENFKTALTTQETNFQEILNQLEIEHQNDLTKLENKYDQKIALLKIQSEVRTASLIRLKKETALNYWKGFLTGSLSGLGIGTYLGLKIAY